MKEIYKKNWVYSFYENNGKYFVDVLCGTVGMYNLLVQLNDIEIESYVKYGITYIDSLVKKIQENPSAFSYRE